MDTIISLMAKHADSMRDHFAQKQPRRGPGSTPAHVAVRMPSIRIREQT
ncbi:hypothetical protein OG429_34115 [Streptomyces sp. NBC_00190]|nr:hypothetical protein [Streptomyces sp. NBC_00190]WSZ43861.1 hypothetical protein OG239_36575 [Streptomyces sp. NBC_00868]